MTMQTTPLTEDPEATESNLWVVQDPEFDQKTCRIVVPNGYFVQWTNKPHQFYIQSADGHFFKIEDVTWKVVKVA